MNYAITSICTFVYKFLCGHMFLFFLGMHLEVECLGSIVTLFNFLRNSWMFSRVAAPFYIPISSSVQDLISPHLSSTDLYDFLILAFLVGVKWYWLFFGFVVFFLKILFI